MRVQTRHGDRLPKLYSSSSWSAIVVKYTHYTYLFNVMYTQKSHNATEWNKEYHSSSFGACRWRSRSRECAPGNSVLCLLETWCKTEVERTQVCLHRSQPGMSRTTWAPLPDLGSVPYTSSESTGVILGLVRPSHVAKQLEASGTISDSKGCPVRLRTSEFVTCSDHVMFSMRRRHHWSRALILQPN